MASNRKDAVDPYAPPPMYHDRSGRVVRVGLVAVLLAAIGVGYFAWSASNPRDTATLPPPVQQQQLADAGYRVQPEQIPQAQQTAPTPPAPSAPSERRIAPSRSESAPAESTPPPVRDVPTSPEPIPPGATTPQGPDAVPPAQG